MKRIILAVFVLALLASEKSLAQIEITPLQDGCLLPKLPITTAVIVCVLKELKTMVVELV